MTEKKPAKKEVRKIPPRPLQRKGAELRGSAERIYRRYCRGVPCKEGAVAHVVKTMGMQGHQVTSAQVREWCRKERWDESVRNVDMPLYTSLEVVKERREAQLTDTDYADLQAVKEAVLDLQEVASALMARAGVAIQAFVPESLSEAVTVAKAAKDLVESTIKIREMLGKFAGDGAKDVLVQVDGRNVEAQIIPAARDAVPNLAGSLAQFERAAREGKKH